MSFSKVFVMSQYVNQSGSRNKKQFICYAHKVGCTVFLHYLVICTVQVFQYFTCVSNIQYFVVSLQLFFLILPLLSLYYTVLYTKFFLILHKYLFIIQYFVLSFQASLYYMVLFTSIGVSMLVQSIKHLFYSLELDLHIVES